MEEEFLDFDTRSAWGTVYQEIRNESNDFNYTFKDAKKLENKNLNRYRDVNPFDHSRVRLQRGEKDYINASLVRVPHANRSYILTQGPLPATSGHFWLMIWEQKSKAILMLNRVIEKNTVKCHQYWPIGIKNGGEDDMILTDVGLKVTYISEKEASYYTTRELLLTDLESGKTRTVLQFHYTTWPDFGVPESPAAFLNFLLAVRESGALNANVGPAVVHCSAGIGRSGTFCLVDSCLVLIEKNGDSNSINIRELLLEMRRYRMGLIQTPDQLRFSYVAIIEGAKEISLNKVTDIMVPSDTEEKKILNNAEEKCEAYDESDMDHSEEVTQSEGSEEGIVKCPYDNIEEPPPLPPRSIRHSESPTSVDLISDSAELQSGQVIKKLRGNSFPQQSNSEQNKPCENSDRKINHSHDAVQEGKANSNSENDLRQDKITESKEELLKNSEDLVADEATIPESAVELRKRKRKERSEKTAAMVQNIKKKQKESEVWQKRRSIIKRLSLGLALLLGTGVLVYRYCSKDSSG